MSLEYNLPSENPNAAFVEDCLEILNKQFIRMEKTLHRLIESERSFAEQYYKLQVIKERWISIRNTAFGNRNVTSDTEPENLVNAFLNSGARRYAFNRQRVVNALKAEHVVMNATVERITHVDREILDSLDIKVNGVGFYQRTCQHLIGLIEYKLKMITKVRSCVTTSVVSKYLHQDTNENFVTETTDLMDKYVEALHIIAARC